MKLYFVCFFTLFVFTINNIKIPQANCPAVCECTSTSTVSDQCFICLEKQFKRNYRTQNKTCPCIQNYVQNYPPTDYCCAQNCTLCYWQGCYECRTNWTKTLNGAYYICVCKENYIYDQELDDCICLGSYQEYATQYFARSRFQCYPCPNDCKCNFQGCSECSQQSNRSMNISSYKDNQFFHTCDCSYGYKETNGVCIRNEDIINNNCDRPLTRSSNGSCICDQPYFNSIIFGCICKSIKEPTSYYIYRGICYSCPDKCKCDEYGCVYCSILANRIIYQNHCTCVNDTGIFQLNGQCVCVSPYNRICQCNNQTYPQLFFTNKNNQCKKCPQGCQCNKSGCKSCNQVSHRNQTCSCIWPYLQLDGLCIGCPQNFIFKNGQCVCSSTRQPTLYYQDFDQKKCSRCPQKCNCDQSGCNFCFETNKIHRKLQSQFNNDTLLIYYTCYCDTANNFRQNSSYQCQCIPPYVFNQTTENCECQDPYIINNSKCICNSQLNSKAYYSYSDTDCRPCPLECNCSSIGCYSCSTRTGRIILIDQSSNYICPCFPIQQETNQSFCMTCKYNQYLWQDKCIDCDQSCKTCDENGCLECNQLMHLQNKTCVCQNNLYYYNQRGCICQQGFFLKQKNCLACPLNCVNCQLNSKVQNRIQCIQCNIAVFRKNDTSQQCPCIDYYAEALIRKQFCCHWSCKDCDISGCISCVSFSYRQLNYTNKSNVTCSCMNGFVQNHQIVCSCPLQKFRYHNKCQSCPSYCNECQLEQQIITCIKCIDGLNRQRKINQKVSNQYGVSIYDCDCVGGYQSSTNQAYCYPKSCQEISVNGLCAICGPNRTQTRNVSYCNCTVGFFEDLSYTCRKCYEGCLQCISYDICIQCDINNDYYLVFNKKQMVIICVKPDFSPKIFYQQKDNIILEIKGINKTNNQNNKTIKLINSTTQYLSIQNLSLYLILLTQNATVPTIKLNVLKCDIINTNILLLKFNNLTNNDQVDPFLLYINSTNQYGRLFQQYYLMKDYVYNKNTISYSGVQEIFIYLFIVLIMITSLITHILGEKHNQLMYYCQTIYFIAMNVKDTHMYLVPFLNYFRITTFNFTLEDSGSPFNNYLSDWTIYFQKSYGNYRYFSVDDNLIRNVGLALYLAIQNLFLEIIFRIIYAILFRSQHKMFAKKYKKIVYRSLQWIRKTTIYPLIFFSLSTLILYQIQYSFIEQQFRQVNKNYSISILVLYTIGTFVQFMFEQISKLYRYELLLEYFFNITNSIIIITSVYNQYILFAIIPLILLRNILQYVKYRIFMRNPQLLYKYINILNLISCFIIIPIYFCNLAGTLTLILLYVVGIVMLRVYLINVKQNLAKFEKKIVNMKVNDESQTQSKFVNIQHI